MNRKTRAVTTHEQQAPAGAEVQPTAPLLADLRRLIESARQAAAVAVNAGLTLLYWHIGQRIRSEVLAGARAAYGEQMVSTVSRQLTLDYGRSFGEKNLRHMMRFAEVFDDPAIVSTLAAR